MKYVHGADVLGMMNKYNKNEEILDFSSNINPNLPSNIDGYVLKALEDAIKYPDINYINLRKSIGSYLNLNYEYVIPGNGASEIIYLLMKSLRGRLAILNPTFSEYERGALLNGVEVEHLYLDKEFKVNIDDIKSNLRKFKYLFICNPNNPSGNVQDLEELLKLLKEHNKTLIVDETFMEFVYEYDYSMIKYIGEYDNIIIIKAITKFFGLPGLRLGYGISSNKELMETMWENKEPWTVNTFAENVTVNILKDKEYIIDSKEYFKKEISFMLEELRKIKRLEVFHSDTNFILMKLSRFDSSILKEKMFLEKNILIRDASNFNGLSSGYIRVAVKKRHENEALIKALNEIMEE